MPIKLGDRYQLSLLPPSIEDYVGNDHIVRAYDAFVEYLEWNKLGMEMPGEMGRPKYDPKVMLKLLLYTYSYGVRSSRKIERECHNNLSYIWLTGGLKPDHKTIAEFRRQNKKALNDVFKQCVRFCIKCDLIAGNILFVDGTKIRANASIKNTYSKEKCLKMLNKVDKRIAALLEECEAIDQAEANQDSHVKLKKELSDKNKLKEKVKGIMRELEEEKRASKNITDPDCANMRSVQGTHASYNVQHVVDNKNGLIVNIDAVNKSNDSGQFADQIEQANKAVDNKCKIACGDAGYANTEELEKIDVQAIKVVVPSQKQALHGEQKPFNRDEFSYDEMNDKYICPEGEDLKYRGINNRKKAKIYCITESNKCRVCKHFGICTKSKYGRKIARSLKERFKEKLEKQYLTKSSQRVYSKRKEKVEHPFGHIKRNLKFDSFLLRGKKGALAEMSLIGSCFNIVRTINIMGMPEFMTINSA